MAKLDPWSELMMEFCCLWDPEDPCFNDTNQRTLAYERLFVKYNRRSGPIDMVTLKLWTASFHRHKMGRKTMGVCMKCIQKSKDIAPLLPDFPCLWDFHDLNFSDKTVKDQCLAQLLSKYNENRVHQIEMETLSMKLKDFNGNRLDCAGAKKCENVRAKPKQQRDPSKLKLSYEQLSVLLKYPCLWDPKDPNFTDNYLKDRVCEQLLEVYNADAGMNSMDMDCLKEDLRTLVRQNQVLQGSTEQQQQLLELLKDYPYLWDPQDLNYFDNNLKADGRKQLLERYNAVASVPLHDQGLKRKIISLKKQLYKHPPGTKTSRERLAELIEQFPCLSDPQYPDFNVVEEKERAREELLARYNAVSSVPIDMNKLNNKIHHYLVKQYKQAKALDPTSNLLHSEDSQNSQTNSISTECSINEVPEELINEPEHYEYDMDSDYENESDYEVKDVKLISVTDTEFVKQSINVCVKETNEGKRRVYVDLNALSLSRDDHDRSHDDDKNNDEKTESLADTEYSDNVPNKKAKIDLNSSFPLCENYRTDSAIAENEVYLASNERDIITNEKTKTYAGIPATQTKNAEAGSDVERTDTKRMGTFSETIGENGLDVELWYSVELPNIFR